MSSCCPCWKKKRGKRRAKRWQIENASSPSMVSAVHALMQHVNISHELKAKATLASAALAMMQRTQPNWQSKVADEPITETILVSALDNTEESTNMMAIEAGFPLKENVVEDETLTSETTITVVSAEISTRAAVSGSTETGDAVSAEVESCAAPKLVYYRLMLPNWLRQNATWSSSYEGDDLNLEIKSDSSDWENIFRIQILPPCQFDDCDDITVKMNVGVLLPEKAHTPVCHSKMAYMISDGHFAIGIQLNDPQRDYATRGPYEALEGDVGSKMLRNPNTKVAATVCTTSRKNPNQFELSFKPSDAWGSAYCAVDDGHKIVAQYSDTLKLSKGLRFEMYRHKSKERYTINYVEFFVYQDSRSLLSVLQKCGNETVC